ncbi:uncharacterized protein [Coffea arabica]|uniref:Reverse transcriptase zinc-binding domain-containing protein n=1 Tax=Coffea arabica TaxID=13443 RepID=A0ABM4W2R9_COFAR
MCVNQDPNVVLTLLIHASTNVQQDWFIIPSQDVQVVPNRQQQLMNYTTLHNQIQEFSKLIEHHYENPYLVNANDESLLCCKASKQEAQEIKEIIQLYGKATGQVVNFEKSAMFFTRNTPRMLRGEISEVLDNMREAQSGKYLGLPMTFGRAKNQVFGYLNSKISSKLQGLCKASSAKIARFWWGGGESEKKVYRVRWSKLFEVKGKGEMGFRDLEASNMALLAKQIWRIVTNPNLLVSKVLKARYMKEIDWLEQQPPNNASWCWKSYVVAKGQCESMNRSLEPNLETSWEIRKHTVWKKFWSLNVKMKLKHFRWSCLQNGLDTNEAIYKRFGKGNKICHCCGEETETIEHIFFFCPKAKVVWKLAPVKWEGLVAMQGNLWRWWEAVMQSARKTQGEDRIRLTVNVLWQIWKARNKLTFQSEIVDAKLMVDKAQQEWIEYEAANESDSRANSSLEMEGQVLATMGAS